MLHVTVDDVGRFLLPSVYINSSMFHEQKQASLKAASNVADESVVHPFPNLFRLLGLTPFKKVCFSPYNCEAIVV